MSVRKISKDTSSVTSLQESQAGLSLWELLDGQQTDHAGPEVAHALHSQPQDERKRARHAARLALSRALEEPGCSSALSASTPGTRTEDTCSPSSTASSLTADLQWFLGNRFRETMDLSGSPEYELDWSEADMLLGPPICRLRASARRTSASESGGLVSGWRSPCAEDGDKGRNSTDSSGANHLQRQAELAGWSTPDSSHHGAMAPEKVLERINAYADGRVKKATTLDDLAVIAGWPTPMAASPATEERSAAGNSDFSRIVESLVPSGWSTPTVQDAENLAAPSQFERNSFPLNVQAAMAGWATPAATTWGDTPESHLERKRKANESGSSVGMAVTGLDAQVQFAIRGQNVISSTAETKSGDESRGVLNPAFSGWLMGFPWIWTYCGLLARRSLVRRKSPAASESCEDTETRSTRMSEPSSSP